MNQLTHLKRPTATIVGLAIALFATPIFIAAYRYITGETHSDWQVVGRELGIFLLVGVLLWIVKTQEALTLTSIGLHVEKLRRSLLRGLTLTVFVLAVTVCLYLLLQRVGIRLGEEPSNVFHPSLLTVTLIMLRAGVTEEIFYRGYAIERLQSLSGNKLLASLVPLIIFAAGHYRQGLGGIVAAFILGGIFTVFYLKYRGDFVLNVILPLVSSG
jgi:membrane protease YdiL (CAAX protease family)